MTFSESDFVCVEDGEEIELIEAIEPGSLEWFRSRMQMPLLVEAFFEYEDHRAEFGHSHASAKSASYADSEIWDLLILAETLSERFEQFDDPNAKEIVARLRKLTGCAGRLRSEQATQSSIATLLPQSIVGSN
jgi:hypothetical protein